MRKLRIDEIDRKTVEVFKKAQKIPIIIVLDNVRSLNNIGSAFRTADAFLIEAIYLCGFTACPPHKDIHKTALGATESVDWKYFKTTMDALDDLKKKLVQDVRKRIGPIACLKEIYFVEDLPKTRSGKIMRRILKGLLAGEDIKNTSTLVNPGSVKKIKENAFGI